MRDKGVWLASYKQVTEFRQTVAIPSMFPSGKGRKNQADDNHNSELGGNHLDSSSGSSVDVFEPTMDPVDEPDEEVCEFPIERCMRIVPHDQNSGAFFIAVLRKVAPLPGTLNSPTLVKDLNVSLNVPVLNLLENVNLVCIVVAKGNVYKQRT